MKPTILVGDFIFVDKYWPGRNAPQQGDLIVFKYPRDPALDYVMRCIAIGGQTVAVRDGYVFLDSEPEGQYERLGQSYDTYERQTFQYNRINLNNGKRYTVGGYVEGGDSRTRNFGPVTVPEGHYFVMGDNRDNSADSRIWGFVPKENIVGKAGLVYWSWNRFDNSVRWSRIGDILD
jgi:signal peptidase I